MTNEEKRQNIILPLIIKYGEEIKEVIKNDLKCETLLKQSKSGLYCCPFCGSGEGDKHTGALKVFRNTNRFHCNKCGESGDVIALMQKVFNIDYHAALLTGAEEIRLDVEQFVNDLTRTPKNGPKTALYASVDKVTDATEKAADLGVQEAEPGPDFTDYYYQCREQLKNTPAALQYFTGRGIDLEAVYKMFVGYDPKADPAGAGHTEKRVIYPCSPGYYVAKSINPETLPQYRQMQNKGGKPCLFNYKAIYKGGPVFICEGVEDCLSFLTAGAAAVSINSTGNYRQVRYLIEQKRPGPDTVFIIWLDNDNAGNDTEKLLINDLEGLDQTYITMDDKGPYNDPNDTLRHDRGLFMDMIRKAQDRANTALQQQVKKGPDLLPENQETDPEQVKQEEQQAQEKQFNFDDFITRIQTDAYKPIATGVKWFDDLLGGGILKQSVLLLLAAPSAGKTTLMQQMAQEIAKQKQPVIYLNLEMSREQMLAKGLSSLMAAVPEEKAIRKTAAEILQGYKWTDQDRAAVLAAADKYRREIDPYLQYNPESIKRTPEGLRDFLIRTGEAAKRRGEKGPVIVLDYLHLLQSDGRTDAQETIKAALIVLKDYVMKYDSLVFTIAATNRISNTSGIGLDSGRDSSAIEFTADYQLSLNYTAIEKNEVKEKITPEGFRTLQRMAPRRMTVSVLKGRLYETGQTADLNYFSAYNRFYGPGEWMPMPDNDVDTGKQKVAGKVWGK